MKKFLSIALLSLIASAAYADGSVNVNVPPNGIPQTEWHLNGEGLISYQFNNQTNKTMHFSVVIEKGFTPLYIYCWNKNEPAPPTITVYPGVPFECTSNDTIKMSGDTSQRLKGHYSIQVDNQAK